MVAVEVGQGTLSTDGRCGGQAGNTERRWSWFRADSTTTKERGQEEEEQEQADIKSNNPHLTGGEKLKLEKMEK